MTFERLTSIKKSSHFQFRLKEENRLGKLAEDTESLLMRKKFSLGLCSFNPPKY